MLFVVAVVTVVVVVVVVVVVPAKSASGSALGTLWKSRPNFLVAKTSCLDFGSLSSLFFTWQLQATPLGFWMSDVEFWSRKPHQFMDRWNIQRATVHHRIK